MTERKICYIFFCVQNDYKKNVPKYFDIEKFLLKNILYIENIQIEHVVN